MKQIQKIRLICFVLLFALLCTLIPHCLVAVSESRDTPRGADFLEERYNSLDAVFMGSSYVYSFWEPPVAWEDHGIAVYSYASSSFPFAATEYMLAECRKTQPDALYIIEMKTLLTYITANSLQYTFNYVPPSVNKLKAIHACADYGNLSFDEELELYIPLFKFHSNWESIYDNRDDTTKGLKGAVSYPLFWERVPLTEGLEPHLSQLGSVQLDTLNSLLDYCDASGAKVLFVATPSYVQSELYLSMIDQLGGIITQRGYDFMNFLLPGDGIDPDPAKDYYNPGHVNIGGAIEFTDFFADYLVNTYGFADKRGQPGWESWDASVQRYKDLIWEPLWPLKPDRYGPPPEVSEENTVT